MYGIGITECQWFLIIVMLVQAMSGGAFSQLTFQNVFDTFVPSLTKEGVAGNIQYLINSTSAATPLSDSEALRKAEALLSENFSSWFIMIGCIPTCLGIVLNILNVLRTTKHSSLHALEGLLPLGIIVLYIYSCFAFTSYAWEAPSIVIFSMAPFFCLNASRVIISTVTKQKFSILEHFHLSAPIITGLVLLPVHNSFGLSS